MLLFMCCVWGSCWSLMLPASSITEHHFSKVLKHGCIIPLNPQTENKLSTQTVPLFPPALAVRHFDWQTNVGVRECRRKMGREQKPRRQSQYFISTPEEELVV